MANIKTMHFKMVKKIFKKKKKNLKEYHYAMPDIEGFNFLNFVVVCNAFLLNF